VWVIAHRLRRSSAPPAMWVEMFISFRHNKEYFWKMDNEIRVQRHNSHCSKVLLSLHIFMGFNAVG
jgi:hypothetical protein